MYLPNFLPKDISYTCSKMTSDIKCDVKLCIKQKMYTIQMTGDVLQGIETNGLADNIVKSFNTVEGKLFKLVYIFT